MVLDSETPMIRLNISPPPIYGCNNPLATNYNPNANTNDGSCLFPSFNVNFELELGCRFKNIFDPNTVTNVKLVEYPTQNCYIGEGSLMNHTPSITNYHTYTLTKNIEVNSKYYYAIEMDGNWINCDEPFELFSSYTCNLSQQTNNESYRIVNVSNDTTVHDNWGSCVEDICGCTDYYASNYNPSATLSSNDCEYCFGQTNILLHQNNTFANCDGALIIDHNDTSIFQPTSVYYYWSNGVNGKINVNLCEGYHISYTYSDGSGCTYVDTFTIGTPASYACTSPMAENYNPTANIDDGSCFFCNISFDPHIT